jgi:ATP-dependent DNA ligase
MQDHKICPVGWFLIRKSLAIPYLNPMPKRPFEPCIPTRGAAVPAGPDWIHEIKHDGYRLIVQRQDKRVRLFTRNGHDWTDRYPLIVEAALHNRASSFVLDGEAVCSASTGSAISTGCIRAGTMPRCSCTLSTR